MHKANSFVKCQSIRITGQYILEKKLRLQKNCVFLHIVLAMKVTQNI